MAENETIEDILHRAAVFHLLAGGFAYPGSALDLGIPEAVARLSPDSRPRRVETGLEALARTWKAIDDDTLREEYSRLFIGGDAVVPHETAYTDTGRNAELADINGFYLAFGFELRDEQREASDHLCVELEFYSLLLLKQAYALQQSWRNEFDITHDAAKSFLRDHLGRWVETVRALVRKRGTVTAYQALLDAAADAVHDECKALGVQPAPLTHVAADFMQAPSFVCPLDQAAVAGPAFNERPGCAGPRSG